MTFVSDTQRVTEDQINKFDLIQLRSADGTLIDFKNVAEVSVTSGPAQIDRYNRSRKIELSGNAPPGYVSGDLMDKMTRLSAVSTWRPDTKQPIWVAPSK